LSKTKAKAYLSAEAIFYCDFLGEKLLLDFVIFLKYVPLIYTKLGHEPHGIKAPASPK
jgi:hypothetical protein